MGFTSFQLQAFRSSIGAALLWLAAVWRYRQEKLAISG